MQVKDKEALVGWGFFAIITGLCGLIYALGIRVLELYLTAGLLLPT